MAWIGFIYLGHRYKFARMTDEIVGAHFTNDFIPEGKLRFGPVATAAIKIWCQNEGFAGIRLEDYLDKVLGRHQ